MFRNIDNDYYLSIMQEIATHLKSQLQETADKNNHHMEILVRRLCENQAHELSSQITQLIKQNNTIALTHSYLCNITSLVNNDLMPYALAFNIRGIAHKVKDNASLHNLNTDLLKILSLEAIRNPTLQSVFKKSDEEILATKALRTYSLINAKQREREEAKKLQEEKKLEDMLSTPPKIRCVIL